MHVQLYLQTDWGSKYNFILEYSFLRNKFSFSAFFNNYLIVNARMFVPPAHKERKIRQLENVIYSKHIIEFKIKTVQRNVCESTLSSTSIHPSNKEIMLFKINFRLYLISISFNFQVDYPFIISSSIYSQFRLLLIII